jgi:hypothetical protein
VGVTAARAARRSLELSRAGVAGPATNASAVTRRARRTSRWGQLRFHDFLHVLSFAGDSDLTFPQMKKWWESAGPYWQP